MSPSHRVAFASLTLVLTFLGACGGSGDGGDSGPSEKPSAEPGQEICDAVSAAQLDALIGADTATGTAVSTSGLIACTWTSADGVVAAAVGSEDAVPSGDGAANSLGSALGLDSEGFSNTSLTTNMEAGTARSVLVFSNTLVVKEAVDPVIAALADVEPPSGS